MSAVEYLHFKPITTEESTQRVDQLREQLAQNEGASILVVTREWKNSELPRVKVIDGCFWSRVVVTSRLIENRYLGIVEDPYLTSDGTTFEVHSPMWVYFGGNFSDRRLRTREASLTGVSYPLRVGILGVPLDGEVYNFQGRPVRKPGSVLDVLVGDEAISTHYQERSLDRMREIYPEVRIIYQREQMPDFYQRNIDQDVLREYDEMKKALFDRQASLPLLK